MVYPHPKLQPVLESTYGVVLYQEQVMQIAQELAGFSLGQADLLRRAMGKKKPEEMARVRQEFLQGTDARGIDHKLANEIFDLMEKFAGYAFNKSHSATYAVVSFQTAWLKAHYPAQFMAANLSAEMHNVERVVVLVDEVRRMNVPLLPPSVNRSEFRFTVHDDQIVYGLGAVRGVGEGPVTSIVTAREQGAFTDLHDFCRRVDPRRVNKRVHEALIASGAMDDFALPGEEINTTRARLMAELAHAVQSAEQLARDAQAGMSDMFGGVAAPAAAARSTHAGVVALRTSQRLQGEKESLGLYLTGHPIEEYEAELRHFCKRRIGELRAEKKSQLVCGMVVSTRIMKSRRGAPMCFLALDDRSARIEVSVFPETYEQFGQKIIKDALLIVEGEVQTDDFSGGLALRAEKVFTIAEARQRYSDGFVLDFSREGLPPDFSPRLKQLLSPHRCGADGCEISILYCRDAAQARISLGRDWQVHASDDLLRSLRDEFGGLRATRLRPGMNEAPSQAALEIERAVGACLAQLQPARVWIGYSGGADSTALLVAVQRVMAGSLPGIRLCALHVDHGLQSASASWAEHCREVCVRRGIECVVERARVSRQGNLEGNARGRALRGVCPLCGSGRRFTARASSAGSAGDDSAAVVHRPRSAAHACPWPARGRTLRASAAQACAARSAGVSAGAR